ncbi:hypothetical protein [Caulobacter segnis]|uniref:hypothetical protein n=1 Tax=Caulobacter segnis TaxID=88688 RepID=UPI0028567272|nr:hypothetical protein [Caulobacter segnis]MDR6623748.1 hypothetical protein [Caulobacter segnis]
MNIISRMFGAVQPRFLARAYFLGALFFAMTVWIQLQASHDLVRSVPVFLLFAVSTLLFPFSKLVWNEARDFIVGDTVFFGNAIIVVFAKFLINAMLWSFAIFVAPLGMAYLWFRTRGASSGVA